MQPSLQSSIQSLGHIGEQVLGMFTASTQPDETVRDGIATPAGAPLSGRMDATKTGGFIEQVAGCEETFGMGTIRQDKTHHWPAEFHLLQRYGVRRVVRQAWVAYPTDFRPGSQVV